MFSNGTEWDAWNAAWCETCVHDVNGPEDGCQIVLQLLLGEKPEEVGHGPLWSPQTVAYCTKYEPRPRPAYHGEVVGAEINGDLLVKITGVHYAMHEMHDCDIHGGGECGQHGICRWCNAPWPCASIRALDGAE